MAPPRPPVFLTARWEHVLMLSYEVDPALLRALVPDGVELDAFEGRTFVSLVGFRFLGTRVRGMPIPFHRDFNEVNLRFYVRRRVDGAWRRGVTFVKEIVPRRLIAWVARSAYEEPYVALPMRHEVPPVAGGRLAYGWRDGGRWHGLSAVLAGAPAPAREGSLEHFLVDHLWGYTKRKVGTAEYEVEHPPWRLWRAEAPMLDADVRALYGDGLAAALRGPPANVLAAEGSPIVVRSGLTLPPVAPA
jgi:uncharacterized protein